MNIKFPRISQDIMFLAALQSWHREGKAASLTCRMLETCLTKSRCVMKTVKNVNCAMGRMIYVLMKFFEMVNPILTLPRCILR